MNEVAGQRDYEVDWRFISLRLLNAHIDYDAHFPPGYEDGHTAGLRLLRVAARLKSEHGPERVGDFYTAVSSQIFDIERDEEDDGGHFGSTDFLEPILERLGLPAALAAALDDSSLDSVIQAETDRALARTGKDVGTPIISLQPPDGPAFFGPVISRLPNPEDAVELWDHVVALARFPGFAEMKRSLRERPQLAAFGVDPDNVGVEEDWHGGSRRQKK